MRGGWRAAGARRDWRPRGCRGVVVRASTSPLDGHNQFSATGFASASSGANRLHCSMGMHNHYCARPGNSRGKRHQL